MNDPSLWSAAFSPLSGPRAARGGVASVVGAETRLRAEVGGGFSSASSQDRQRLLGVLAPEAGEGDGGPRTSSAGSLWRPSGEGGPFVRREGQTVADAVRHAADLVWSAAEEAVFRFRRGDDAGARASLGRAASWLRASVSPAHVRRTQNEDGAWVIRDVLDGIAAPSAEPTGFGPGSGEGTPTPEILQEMSGAAGLASQLLRSYFVSRVLGLASEARQSREAIERAFLREETS